MLKIRHVLVLFVFVSSGHLCLAAQNEVVEFWKTIPEWRAVRYQIVSVTKADDIVVELKLDMQLRSLGRDDHILIDVSLGEVRKKRAGRDEPLNKLSMYTYCIYGLVDRKRGIDPYGILSPVQSKILKTLVPVPFSQNGKLAIDLCVPGGESIPFDILVAPSKSENPETKTFAVEGNNDNSHLLGQLYYDNQRGYLRQAKFNLEIGGTPTGTWEMSLEISDEHDMEYQEKEAVRGATEVRMLIQEGQRLILDGDRNGAMRLFSDASKKDSGAEHAGLVAAYAATKAGNLDVAADFIELELTKNGVYPPAVFLARLIYQKKNDADKVEQLSKKLQAVLGEKP